MQKALTKSAAIDAGTPSSAHWAARGPASQWLEGAVLSKDNISDVHQPSTKLSPPVTSSPLQSAEAPIPSGLE
jgi:hypothetical protein